MTTDALYDSCPTEMAACIQHSTCAVDLAANIFAPLSSLWTLGLELQAVLLCGFVRLGPLGLGYCHSTEIGKMSRLVIPHFCQVYCV